jgi:electron transfer flavoprotein alpha subunit
MTRRIVAGTKNIWVLPEIAGDDEEIGKLSLGLLSAARHIAAKVGGTVTSLVLRENPRVVPGIFSQYGVSRVYVFQDPLFTHVPSEAYAAAVLPVIREEKPWLFLLGPTPLGRELAPLLAARLAAPSTPASFIRKSCCGRIAR